MSREVSASPRFFRAGFHSRVSTTTLRAAALFVALQGAAHAAPEPLQVLIVGGGPNPNSNQAAIESNVRYVSKLLPTQNTSTTLFADGNKESATVIYQPEGPKKSNDEVLLDALLQTPGQGRGRGGGRPPGAIRPAPPAGFGGQTAVPATMAGAPTQPQPAAAAVPRSVGNFKVPGITQLDGPSKSDAIESAFTGLSGKPVSKIPTFLYFTGHGSKTADNLENNYYNLWDGGKFTVQDLSRQVARLPEKEPVVLVMVQCFSGSFGNILFEGGDPKAAPIDRDIVGFFASTKDRVAAGCTPAVNEDYYYDFTSYFFSALTGRDRLDRKAAPDADFNRDGKVGLDEAFYWSVINDNSIDVPVATSDVFLERFSPTEGESWTETPYKSLLKWASPAQRASLEGLSKALGLTSEVRIQEAQKIDLAARRKESADALRVANERLQPLKESGQKSYLEAFPDLASREPAARTEARRLAVARLSNEAAAGQWTAFQEALKERNTVQSRGSEIGVIEAKQLRFLRLTQKIVRDHNLRTSNDGALKKRYFKLLASEAKTLLPYHG
ncbi:hypothetical protein EON80_06685 [bacterium]|nr:MAG: hypothetical protein EON80_06685 [bacterium]